MHQLTTTRAARNRRLIAVTAWAALIVTAMVLWNGRSQGILHPVESEPAAFLLAAFTTFVSLFAWMLYNPARGVSAETPTLMLAGAATLFTPCVIGFCLMPPESPLRIWLVIGLFLLLAIAVMSPVPDEFFAIPRERHTYIQPVPILNISNRSVVDENPAWFHSAELSLFVDTDRPSLAPSAWRFRDRPDGASERLPAPESEFVDDSLLDDLLLDDIEFDAQLHEETPSSVRKRRDANPQRQETRVRDEQRRVEQRQQAERSREKEQRRTARPHRPATIWFRPRPVKPTTGPTSVPFGPPSPLTLLRRDTSVPSNESVSQDRPVLETPHRVEPRLSSDVADNVDTERRVGGFRSRAADIAGTAAGLAGAAAAAIPSAFRSRPTETGSKEAVIDPFDQVGSRDGSDPGVQKTDDGHQDSESRLSTDAIQVADAARQRTFERTRDESGGELLEGTMTVCFDRGQKRANLHIPFSPPMPGVPEVECEAIGGESLRLRVPERRSYGIRIEARRSDADEPMETEIGFAAVCVPNQ